MDEYSISRLPARDAGSFAEHLAGISERAFSRPPWRMTGGHYTLINRFFAFPSVTLFLASWKESGAIIGFSLGSVLSPELVDFVRFPTEAGVRAGDYHLTWRAVDPDYRGRGIGRALTMVRLDHAGELRCGRVFGDTLHSNLGTLQMHRYLGFEVCGESLIASKNGLAKRVFFRIVLDSSTRPV